MTTILTTTFLVTLAIMVVLWLVSLRLENASIVDIFWGPGFAVIAWTSLAISPAPPLRGWLAAGLVTVWALRLAGYIAGRNLGHGEDYRYRSMRASHGPRFWWVSLFTVFVLQTVLMWVVSLPLQAVHVAGAERPMGWLDLAGAGIFLAGLLCEAVADEQLARFKRSAPPGAVMDRGLWRYSRHPNYFGNFLIWWGLGIIAVAAGAWWTLVGPLVMTGLLLKVSGVALLESTIVERRPAYRDYIARTSPFVPWPPRS